MPKSKIAITMKKEILEEIDDWVREKIFPNRSQAIESAMQDRIDRRRKTRLGRECRKLDAAQEQRFAEEGLKRDGTEWPEY